MPLNLNDECKFECDAVGSEQCFAKRMSFAREALFNFARRRYGQFDGLFPSRSTVFPSPPASSPLSSSFSMAQPFIPLSSTLLDSSQVQRARSRSKAHGKLSPCPASHSASNEIRDTAISFHLATHLIHRLPKLLALPYF